MAGIEVVEKEGRVPKGGFLTQDVVCPSGKRVISGGYQTGHFEIHIYSSQAVQTALPGPYNAWRVTFLYTGSIEGGVQIFTTAVCAAAN